MNRPIFMLSALIALAAGISSRAQFSMYEHPNVAGARILPMARMLESVNHIVFGSYDYFYADQRWDASMQHYYGRLPLYFHSPEIPAAGRRVVRVQRSLDGRLESLGDNDAYRQIMRGTDQGLDDDDNRREQTRYFYDAAGWLVAIRQETLNPAYNGYAEASDSFYYERNAGRLTGLRWIRLEHSSGSSDGGTPACDPPRSFHHNRKRTELLLKLDSFENIVFIDSRSSERRDDCDQGVTHWHRDYAYDSAGRLVHIADSSEKTGARFAEQLISYRILPAAQFLASGGQDVRLSPLQDPEVRRWLQTQGPLHYVERRRTAKTYAEYDGELGRPVLKASIPDTRDSSFFLLNARQQRVVSWDDHETMSGHNGHMMFYTNREDSAAHASLTRQRTVRRPPASLTNPLVQPPFRAAIQTDYVLRYDTIGWSGYRIIRFGKAATAGARQSNIMIPDSEREIFLADDDDRSFASPTAYRTESSAMIDKNGLVRYIWLRHSTYKLSYE